MSIDLNNLNLVDNDLPTQDPTEMPAQRGTFVEPPQPGIYRFRMPAHISNDAVSTKVTPKGQRLQITFADETAIYNQTLNKNHPTFRVDNVEYEVGKKNGPKTLGSSLAYLLKALGHTQAFNTQADYVNALNASVSKEFKATATLGVKCNADRNRWKEGKEEAGVTGCGRKYDSRVVEWGDGSTTYTNQKGDVTYAIPLGPDGKMLLKWECECGADLRGWPRLDNFKAV